jgi:hypothetical protein
MISDQIKAVGKLTITVTGDDGQVKDQRIVDNLVVTAGKNFIAARMTGTAANVMSHMAIGTGSTAAAAGDTALGTESARVALTSSTTTNAQTLYVATFPAGTGTGAITEAGLLNAGVGGSLLCRTVFAAVNKGANDAMTINWTVTIQ